MKDKIIELRNRLTTIAKELHALAAPLHEEGQKVANGWAELSDTAENTEVSVEVLQELIDTM